MSRFLSLMSIMTMFAANIHAAGTLLCCNKGDRTLGIIDPVAGKELATVAENGVTGHEVIASPDGKTAYVPIYGNSGVGKTGTDGSMIRVIDLFTRQIKGTIDFGKGVRPHCAMFGPQDGLLYVSTELEKAITVIDPATLKIIGQIPTGQAESHMFTISSDGKRGYTANVSSGTVSVLDMEGRKLIKIIPVCKTTQRIAITPDNHWVFTSDQGEPRLAVIDTTKNEIAQWIPLPGNGYGGAVTPDGRWFLLALPRARRVAVIDVQTMAVSRSIPVPANPQETLINPDGAEAYVSCDTSKQIAVIDLKSWTVTKLIAAGKVVDGLAWAKGQ
jgi:YVTN family beta-propeller protein